MYTQVKLRTMRWVWTPQDIVDEFRPDWTLEQAQDWMERTSTLRLYESIAEDIYESIRLSLDTED